MLAPFLVHLVSQVQQISKTQPLPPLQLHLERTHKMIMGKLKP